jgi:hypothetical protein
MRPTTLLETAKTFHALRRPVMVEGGPGLGKTQLMQQMARELGIAFIHFHAPTMQPEDFAIPAPNADRTAIDFLINSRFPIEGSDHADEGHILIDEAPQGDNSIQKTIANLIQEREVYGRKLKPGWSISMTGNRVSDRAGANRVLSHLRNRVTTLEFEPSLDDWCNWALDNDIRPELIQFVRFKPGMLNDFDPQRDINPTPRAWAEGVSPIIDNVPVDAEFEVIKGAVGEGAAAEFVGFLKICRKLPNIDALLMRPADADVPTEPSVRYAIAGAIAHRATEDNFERVMTYAKRLPPEFTVLTVLDSIRKNPDVQNTKAFTEWAIKEGEKVLM